MLIKLLFVTYSRARSIKVILIWYTSIFFVKLKTPLIPSGFFEISPTMFCELKPQFAKNKKSKIFSSTS